MPLPIGQNLSTLPAAPPIDVQSIIGQEACLPSDRRVLRFEIEPATMSCVDELVALCQEAVRASGKAALYSDLEQQAWFASVSDPHTYSTAVSCSSAWIARATSTDRAVVGYLNLHPWKPAIASLYVLPIVQGSGVGTGLVAQACALLRVRGATEVLVDASLPSAKFYQKLGFECSPGGLSTLYNSLGGATPFQRMHRSLLSRP